MYEASEIIIDDREAKSEQYRKGFRSHSIPADVKRLDHGDFLWHITDQASGETRTVSIERKTHSDFANSATDGRLERFTSWVPHPEQPTYKFILIEGTSPKRLEKAGFGGWEGESIDNALVEAQMRGIYVIRCNWGEVVKRLSSLYTWMLKNEHHTLSKLIHPGVKISYDSGEKKKQLQFLMGFHGIGEKTARTILDEYGGLGPLLGALLTDDTERLLQIKGIGQGTVKNMKKFLE